jgi:glycosyltransferase involved in cell wall biosynthesis
VTDNQERLRILHVLAPAQFGGLERVVGALATGQRHRGHTVGAAAFLDHLGPEPPLLNELAAADVQVFPVRLRSRAYVQQGRHLRAIVGRFVPDVIHSHGYVADVHAALLRGNRLATKVATVHGFTGGNFKLRAYEWLQTRCYRRFDAVVAVSRPISDRVIRSGVSRERVRLLRNASRPSGMLEERDKARRVLGIPDATFSIGWVGRLSREKGLDLVLHALPALADLDVVLTVVGDGVEHERMRQLARALGLSNRVRFAGIVLDAGRLIRAFDALILSSRTEGTPIILLEAIHGGVPIIATAVGGVPDVVSGTDALLVPPESPAALAEAIRTTLTAPAAAAVRAQQARRRLDNEFAFEPWIAEYERIYRTAAATESA